MVYISFLISHVPPAHSFFQKKSILINLTQNLVQLIFLTLTKQEINTAANWIKSMSGESLVGRGKMQKSYVLSGHSTIHRTNHHR